MKTKKRITIIDIAKDTGFSKSTVSKVLRNESFVKESTKEKIEKSIKKLKYHPDEIARSLVKKTGTNFIGLIISDITNYFYTELVRHVEEAAKKRNCNIILCNTNYEEEEEKEYINILINKRAMGIILATSTVEDKNIKFLINEEFPFIVFGNKWKKINADVITIDNFKSAKIAVNYLIAKGHYKIAHFAGPQNSSSGQERLKGYLKGLEDSYIEVNKKYIFETEGTSKGGYEATKKLLELLNKPTAIFAYNDFVAIGIMELLKERSLEVPNDYSIIGFDDIKLSSLKMIDLTTIKQPITEEASEIIRVLFKRIETGPTGKTDKIIFDTEIIERSSVLDKNKVIKIS